MYLWENRGLLNSRVVEFGYALFAVHLLLPYFRSRNVPPTPIEQTPGLFGLSDSFSNEYVNLAFMLVIDDENSEQAHQPCCPVIVKRLLSITIQQSQEELLSLSLLHVPKSSKGEIWTTILRRNRAAVVCKMTSKHFRPLTSDKRGISSVTNLHKESQILPSRDGLHRADTLVPHGQDPADCCPHRSL